MNKLGFEWPDVDEDEVRKAGQLLRQFGSDLESAIQMVDSRVNGELAAAMRGRGGPAYVSAWNTNRSQNLQQLLDLVPPAATGVDLAADAILATKIKVIAEVTTTVAQLTPLIFAGPFGAAGAAALVIVKKRLLNAVVDTAVEELMNQVLPMVMEPLMDHVPALVEAVLDAPMVESVVGDSDEFYADLEALDQAQSDMLQHSSDVSRLTTQFFSDIGSLDFGGDV